MRLLLNKNRHPRGSTLMVTLFMVCLIGFFIFAYLYLARAQRTIESRSQAWNTALSVAEAGVEEALAQLNPGASAQTVDISANGWGAPSGGFYGPISRTIPGLGSYSIVVSADTFPIIYATGYVSVPYLSSTISREIRVTTTNAPLFSTVLAAKLNINFAGNGIMTDSFNSSNPLQSENGRYPVDYPSRASTNGDVASVLGLVNVANGNVNGTLYLGPTASDTIGSQGAVTGGVSNDFNFEFEDVIVPTTTWLPPNSTNVVIGTNSFQYVFGPGSNNGAGDYTITGLKNSGIYVSNATVRLLLEGNANPTYIQVAGSGTTAGKLIIYMDGPSFNLSGNSSVDGGLASNLAYYGTTNNTAIGFGGNASFTGTIYAPEANFTLGGGGSGTYNFVGAAVLNSATMNGHYAFHFDEALATTGPKRGFLPASWREL